MAAQGVEVKLDTFGSPAKYGLMDETRVPPADCQTMVDVRTGVDRLDEQIVSLLAERFRYMDAAARIKPNREAVRDEWRKADVLRKVTTIAKAEGAPIERIESLYEALVESSIAYEFGRFDATRA